MVLGLHPDPGHDTGAAVISRDADGGRLIVHVNEERLDRVKGSHAFPARAAAACLQESGLTSPAAAELVVLDGAPSANTGRYLKDVPPERIVRVSHHRCHAAASFFTSPFERAAVLVIDGGGADHETQSLWLGEGCRLERLAQTRVPGIGRLYEAVTCLIGFAALEAGKTMGLAPFAAAGAQGGVAQGSPDLGGELGGEFDGIGTDYGRLFDREGRARFASRAPDSFEARAALAQEVQRECERALFHLAQFARAQTGLPHLCLGGGVALNGLANHKLLRAGLFEAVHANPACSDAGIALGAALWGFHGLLGQQRDLAFVSPYTGPSHGRQAEEEALQGLSAAGRHRLIRQGALEQAVELLVAEKCVALFQGRSEMGPRALGNRSILMSPFTAQARERLNRVVKRREPFRPFAPVVPVEHAETYFDLGVPSPFMLKVCPVRPAWRERLAAVTHVDGTARPQTVAADQNARLRTLLALFGERTGIPVLLNTSFNVAGEPLVETPQDAVRCFLGTDIDALLIGDVLVCRTEAAPA